MRRRSIEEELDAGGSWRRRREEYDGEEIGGQSIRRMEAYGDWRRMEKDGEGGGWWRREWRRGKLEDGKERGWMRLEEVLCLSSNDIFV